MAQHELYDNLDIQVDGLTIQTETGGVTLEGALGWEGDAVAATSGPHNLTGKRIVPKVKAKALFNQNLTIEQIRGWTDVRLTLSKSWGTERRVLCHNCSVATLGELGGGAVDVEFHVAGEIQEV